MATFNPDRRPNPEAEKARRKAHLAIVALKKFMGPAAVAEWLREYADNLVGLDIAHAKMDGLVERHEANQAKGLRKLASEIKRREEWREQNRNLRGEED